MNQDVYNGIIIEWNPYCPLERVLFMEHKRLLILGAGQYGAIARETAQAMGCYSEIAFLDDTNPQAAGKFADYPLFAHEYSCAFVALGNPDLRLFWLEKLTDAGYEAAVLVHPRSWVSPSAQLMGGTIVEPMAVVQANTVVENGVLICSGSVVDHNVHIQPGCKVACGAVVVANTTVPEKTHVPAGTCFDSK